MIVLNYFSLVCTHTAMFDENTKPASVHKSSNVGTVKNVPEKAVPHLIKLLHGNIHDKMFLVREFIEFWKKTLEEDGQGESKVDREKAGTKGGKEDSRSSISKRGMIDKIQEIAYFKRLTGGGMRCWCVK